MRKWVSILILFLLVFILSSNPAMAESSEITNSYLRDSKASLSYIVYGNCTFVAVGSTNSFSEGRYKPSALILYSKDGRNWKIALHNTKREGRLNDILWTGEKFMAVGDSGYILASKDGINWEEVAHNIPKVYTDKEIVNGLNFKTNDLRSVAWNGKAFITVVKGYMDTGSFPYHAYISRDGIKWEGLKPSNIKFMDVEYITGQEGIFAAVGGAVSEGTGRSKPFVCWSLDGLTWNKTELAITSQTNGIFKKADNVMPEKVIWDGGQFIVVSTAMYKSSLTDAGIIFYTSKDGKEWSLLDEYIDHIGIGDMMYDNGMYYISAGQYIFYSENLKQFKKRKLNFGINKIVKGGNTFVGVGSSIATSTDGINWSPIKSYPIGIAVNDEELLLDSAPMKVAGRNLVPVRAISEALGAQVKYDDKTGKITINTGIGGNKTLELKIDSNKAYINGREVLLDVPATISNGRTLVPIRFISEGLGAEVSWDEQNQTVVIKHELVKMYKQRTQE